MRHTGWRRLRGDTDRPDLLNLGKKLLGYLDNQRRLSGVKTLTIQREAPDGSIVRARWIGDQPQLEIQTRARGKREPIDALLGGFVTWPTDAAGATALAETQRIVLTADLLHGVRENRYGLLFPPPAGLNRAGNVDWHGKGKNGWVVSWYGPRTRYIDYAYPWRQWVFFKGQAIADVTAHFNPGHNPVVTGAAVTKAGGFTWLIVTSERYNFGRHEDVWALKLSGDPSDPEVVADPASFAWLHSYQPSVSTDQHHPWLFNPDGREARRIVIYEGDLVEQVLTLSDDPSQPAELLAQYQQLPINPWARTESDGYLSALYGTRNGRAKYERRIPVDINDYYVPTGPANTTTYATYSWTTETAESAYEASPKRLIAYEYNLDDTFDADPYRKVAVDYRPDGTVVYAYARGASRTVVETGGFDHTAAKPTDCGFEYVSNDFTVVHTYNENGDAVGFGTQDHTNDYRSLGPMTWGLVSFIHRDETTLEFGVRVGALDLEFTSTYTRRADATAQYDGRNSGTLTGAAVSTASAEWTGEAHPYDDYPAFSDYANSPGGSRAVSAVLTDATVDTPRQAFLAHMDLRNDSLFITEKVRTVSTTETRTVAWDLIDFDGQTVTDTQNATTEEWITRGWIAGEQVLAHSVVGLDTSSTSSINTPQPSSGTAGIYTSLQVKKPWSPVQVGEQTHDQWGHVPRPEHYAFTVLPDPVPLFENSISYEPVTGVAVDASLLYQARNTYYETPYADTLLLWIEFDHAVGVVDGYAGEGNGVRMQFRVDADDFDHFGGWAQYRGRFAFSMPLPALSTDPPLFASLCNRGEIASIVLAPAELSLVAHFCPAWVLANTKAQRLFP